MNYAFPSNRTPKSHSTKRGSNHPSIKPTVLYEKLVKIIIYQTDHILRAALNHRLRNLSLPTLPMCFGSSKPSSSAGPRVAHPQSQWEPADKNGAIKKKKSKRYGGGLFSPGGCGGGSGGGGCGGGGGGCGGGGGGC